MTNEWLMQKVSEWDSEAQVSLNQYVTVIVAPDKAKNLITKLKEDKQTKFDYLFCQAGFDDGQTLGVSYFIESLENNTKILVKSEITNRDNAVIDTVCDLYATANLNEREIFEMYGINFTGHPDMRKLILPDELEGYPLRKDYSDNNTIPR